MDPQQDFKSRYDKYIAGRNQTISGSSSTPPKKRAFSPNKFYFLGIFVGVLLILPVTYLYFANQVKPTDTTQVASTDSITNAQIDKELQQIWGPYYNSVKNDPKYRELAKKQIIQNNIINQGLKENGIVFTAESEKDNPFKEENALATRVVNSMTIDFAFVFINPDASAYQSNVAKVTYSYDLIKSFISQGKTMQEAYDQAKKDKGFYSRITITNDKLAFEDSFDPSISKKLFTYKKGETTSIINSGGGTFILAKVRDTNVTPYATLNEWIAVQEN